MWKRDMELRRSLRPIIPIIFYHGWTPYNLPDNFVDYFEVPEVKKKYPIDFEVILFDTGRYGDELLLKNCNNLYLCASLSAIKHIFDELKDLKISIIPVLKRESEDKLLLLLEYLVSGKDIKEEDLNNIFEEIGGENMPSLAQRWIDQGLQQGLKQGIQQGVHHGMVEIKRGQANNALAC